MSSDFVNEFWNWYVGLISLVGIAGCAVFLWVQSSAHSGSQTTTQTTGHVWDETLREYNNPLPRWWMWLFYITVAFSLVYVVLYPALGKFPGIKGWSSVGEYQQEVDQVNTQTKPLFDKYQKMDIISLSKDKTAMDMGGRLFQTYCMQCHGETAQGQAGKGFPNLTDKDWLWGGEPNQIVESITDGRTGVMPPSGGNPEVVGGAAGAKELANYVRSLSGLAHNADLAAKGKERYDGVCIACHGPDGKGMQAVGAPNLTDKIWLYGSSEDKIVETITQGRSNQMPPWKELVGDNKIHLLAAYVWGLGGGVTPAVDEGPMAVLEGQTAKFYFATGKSELGPEATSVISSLLELAKAKPEAKFSISGFHDTTGDQATNEALAKTRATAVAEALKAAGIAAEHLELNKPAETTGTGSNKEARRVEVSLI